MHLGIVAASPPGAALCFELVTTTTAAEVSLHAHPLTEYMRSIDAGDWDGVAQLMLSSARKLADVGADFLVAPCNTIHNAFDRVASKSPLPWLHIGQEVAREAKRRGHTRLAIVGTSLLLDGPVYRDPLQRCGITPCVPQAAERDQLDRMIFGELVHGRFNEPARQYVVALLERLKEQGCDAAGLCCTELPILLKDVETPLPVLDSTRILARAAVAALAGESPASLR
jgi:aspartate racemase